MCVQNLKSLALSISGITGVAEKCWQLLDTPTLPFLQNLTPATSNNVTTANDDKKRDGREGGTTNYEQLVNSK